MEREEFEAILKAHLGPINKAIEKLEENQEQIVTILTNQARQDEIIKHLHEDIGTCTKDRDEIFSRLRSIEQDNGKKLWDTIKIIMAATGAFLAALLVGRLRI